MKMYWYLKRASLRSSSRILPTPRSQQQSFVHVMTPFLPYHSMNLTRQIGDHQPPTCKSIPLPQLDQPSVWELSAATMMNQCFTWWIASARVSNAPQIRQSCHHLRRGRKSSLLELYIQFKQGVFLSSNAFVLDGSINASEGNHHLDMRWKFAVRYKIFLKHVIIWVIFLI